MDAKTLVLPSSRAIRDFYLHLKEESLFLPRVLTMSEFVAKLCIVEGYRHVDDDTRSLLLLEASDFKRFAKLQIERNFFTFTKNSSYIFKFFEELSAELVDISSLEIADTYAEYEEHIAILVELYKNYETLCNTKKILDKIFLPKIYKLNISYLQSLKVIEIRIAGYLTNFEFELLEQASRHASICVVFDATEFNAKMQKKFWFVAQELEKGFTYTISLNEKKVVAKTAIKNNQAISCESLSEPLLQAAFVQKKIYDFVAKGYDPERIAVILPDENFALMLKTFDLKANLNFAMGESFCTTPLYRKLEAAIGVLDMDSKENEARLQRVGKEIYEVLFPHYYSNAQEVDFIALLESFSWHATTKEERKIYDEEVFRFKHILIYMQQMQVKSLLHLFMQRLLARTLDDIRGGKITVMGVLETRAVAFEGVIIVDFSDAHVPKKSDKDMFLTTKIREAANLPTKFDRENLQKHYYYTLINSAKEVALCYVNTAQSGASRFLKELGIREHNRYKESDYVRMLLQQNVWHAKESQEIELAHSFKGQKLSATKLKTFLTCKRKYYYKYIQKIQDHTIPKDMPQEWEIGTLVHAALKNLYTKTDRYTNVDTLKKDLARELDMACGKNEMEKYLVAMYKKVLEPFCVQEVTRFSDGWHVVSCEEQFECRFAGIDLVGTIDRIDRRENDVLVLDYKTGSYPLYTAKSYVEATDFQLEFYYLLSQKTGGDVACAYYDLKQSAIVYEPFLEEKLEVLESHIKEMLLHESFVFSKCEELKNCLYCEYATICGRF